jgi:hypothetical protein
LAALLALAGCTTTQKPEAARPTVAVESQLAWRNLVKPADLSRIGGSAAAWSRGLETARRAGFGSSIRKEGPLFDPAAALPVPAPAPGAYRCRLFRLGAGAGPRRSFALEGSFFCFISVEGGQLKFVRETGTPRPIGFLYPADETSLIFLGATAERRETSVPAYGDRAERDVVGMMQRVDNFRYRLVLPWRGATPLEIYELVPAL